MMPLTITDEAGCGGSKVSRAVAWRISTTAGLLGMRASACERVRGSSVRSIISFCRSSVRSMGSSWELPGGVEMALAEESGLCGVLSEEIEDRA